MCTRPRPPHDHKQHKMIQLITCIYINKNEYDCGCKQTRHYWKK